ncbi:GNAT family N-acetyltransferase, partial [Pseudonocardia abyssalis]
EDVGVVTDPAHRGAGLSTACAAALVHDIRARGRIPSWTTSPPNRASRAVAARLGFVTAGEGVLWAVGVPVPD